MLERGATKNKRTDRKCRFFCYGAATQIRTGDLILTKDVLYQLSHSSKSLGLLPVGLVNYIKDFSVCQDVFKNILLIFDIILKGAR